MADAPPADRFDLDRFVSAQAATFEAALAELREGRKRTHWMWFIFPQMAGLGTSSMAQRYAIQSRAEAVAYAAHPLLGPRLRACANALLTVQDKSAREIMGQPDDVKLKSSMTLFAEISDAAAPFAAVLERYFAGERDERTRGILAREN